MENCASFENDWTAIFAEDAPISPELATHLKECRACRRLLATHRDWEDLLLEEPGADAYSRMRSGVLDRIRHQSVPWRTASEGSLLSRASASRWWAAAAIAASLFLAGFLSGRGALFSPEREAGHLLQQLRHQVAANPRLDDSTGSPYSYSNVSFSPLADGRLALSFDLSTHLRLVGQKDDPLVKDVLAQTLLNPESLNSRLKALGIAGDVMDPKIKQAMILAMQHDDSLSVRLKAMSLLSAYKMDREVSDAFLLILKEEESVQLRLQALEYLAGEPNSRDALREALEKLSKPEDTPLLLRASGKEIY